MEIKDCIGKRALIKRYVNEDEAKMSSVGQLMLDSPPWECCVLEMSPSGKYFLRIDGVHSGTDPKPGQFTHWARVQDYAIEEVL